MTLAGIVMLVVLVGLLGLSAFFSGTETALFSLSRHQRAEFARSAHAPATTITTLLSETRSLLITLLLGNMTVNVLYFVISSALLIRLSDRGLGRVWMALLTIAPLLLIIMFGEVLPKIVAARITATWSRVCALPMFAVHRAITPIRIVCGRGIITPLARLIAPQQAPASLSPQELESVLTLSQRQGVIDTGEERLLQQVLELNHLKVRDLMIPRVDVQGFDLARPPSELVRMARDTRLRHIPVCRGDLDHIVGIAYGRQVLLDKPDTRQKVQRLVRQVKFVPDGQRVERLLIDLRKTGTTFAVVVDEYGGTAGLITLEDVVEHMVGDIPGAFEPSGQPQVKSLGQGRFRVGADLSVHDWADVFGNRSKAVDGVAALETVSTVGGVVMARLGRLPVVGDAVTLGNVVFRVEAMDGRRIESIIVELQRDEAAASPEPPVDSSAPPRHLPQNPPRSPHE